jgi:hypothetical protein
MNASSQYVNSLCPEDSCSQTEHNMRCPTITSDLRRNELLLELSPSARPISPGDQPLQIVADLNLAWRGNAPHEFSDLQVVANIDQVETT